MAERDLRGTWKGKKRRVSKSSSLIVGMVYKGTEMFFGETVVGMLVQLHQDNDEAVLQTKQDKLVSVQINSLKIQINE